MNDSIIQGKWKEIKGEIQKKWGELTDDEVDRTKGNTTSLIGLIEQKFGIAKEEASQKLNEIYSRYETKGDDYGTVKKDSLSDKVNNKIDETKDKVRH